MDTRTRRVRKELADIEADTVSAIHVSPINDDLFHLRGTFRGPDETPYENGRFVVDIRIPDRYPFVPLQMKFITRVYHCNVSSSTGAICLDILKNAWSPVLTLKSSLISLQSMLCSPEPSDPQDATKEEVAKHYITNQAGFEQKAREWTKLYAIDQPDQAVDDGAISGIDADHIDKFVELGFPRPKVVDALRRLNYRDANVHDTTDERVVQELLKQ